MLVINSINCILLVTEIKARKINFVMKRLSILGFNCNSDCMWAHSKAEMELVSILEVPEVFVRRKYLAMRKERFFAKTVIEELLLTSPLIFKFSCTRGKVPSTDP